MSEKVKKGRKEKINQLNKSRPSPMKRFNNISIKTNYKNNYQMVKEYIKIRNIVNNRKATGNITTPLNFSNKSLLPTK